MPTLGQFMSKEKNRQSWDILSKLYQSEHIISLEDVHYGPHAPGERNLGLIGNVSDLDVLEIGCGGGQNSIVLMKWGARSVIGIDQSDAQLRHARKLAQKEKANVRFLRADMEDLHVFGNSTFDLVVSSHAFDYAENLDRVFQETARVLRNGGRFVFCMLNPIWRVVGTALECDDLAKVQAYFGQETEKWSWTTSDGQSIGEFETAPWRFEQILNGVIHSGLRVETVAEPRGYSADEIRKIDVQSIPYRDSKPSEKFLELIRRIPFSIIISAKKS